MDPSGLSAFVSCRLITLDKCPGVRPIGVGETVWHIIAKAVLSILNRAGGIGPAAPVLAEPVFSLGKRKIPFLQKASNKQSTSVILGLIRLIILSYNR